MVDFSGDCAILFAVMRDKTIEKRKELKKEWESIHPVDDALRYGSHSNEIWKRPKTPKTWEPMLIDGRNGRTSLDLVWSISRKKLKKVKFKGLTFC